MKLSVRKRMHRRDFVQLIGGAAAALPFLELFEHEARAQITGKKSRYVVFIYTNDGVNNPQFWPTSADPTSSPTLKSLAPYKDKVLVLGPKLSGTAPMADTGLTYNTKPAQHRANVCITGSKVGLPLNADQVHAVNKIDGPSLDWTLGQALAKQDGTNKALFDNICLGIHPVGGDTPSEISFDGAGNPLTRYTGAADVTAKIFGGMTAGGPVNAAGAAADLRKQTAISDFLNARFGALKTELSPFDRDVVDRHLTSLRTYEDRKARILSMQSNPNAACKPPASAMVPTDDNSVRTGADTQFLAPFFMQTLVTAFNCNITRVGTVSFGYPGGGGEGGLRMPWLGFNDAQHSVSHHGGGAEKLRKYGLMNAWTISQVKFLMDQLAAVPIPTGGTLLDQTTIYFFNRHGDGNGHTNFALPNMILGGTGGYFKTGQVLALPKTSPTEPLISIANAMGVDLPTFGSGAYVATNPLAGITA
jgi:hypothetical protein